MFTRFSGVFWVMSGLGLCLLGATPSCHAADSAPATPTTLVYAEECTDVAKIDADCVVNNGLTIFPGIGLSSRSSNGYAVYAVASLLPGIAADAKVKLAYSGSANGPDNLRGVHWFTSDDGKTWKEFSINKFDIPVEFSGKYLKLQILWLQAGGPDYGALRKFTLKATGIAPTTPAAKQLLYLDDFSDSKKFDTDSAVNNGLKRFPGIGLSSASSNGYAIYELATLLPKANVDAKWTLAYCGAAAGPDDLRGVHWAMSDDGKTWKDLSINQFDIPVEFSGKYLKVQILWVQASGPDYGYLTRVVLKAPTKAPAVAPVK